MISETKKYEIFNALAKGYNSYTATQWLKTPNARLDGKTPAEMISAAGDHGDILKALILDLKDKEQKYKDK